MSEESPKNTPKKSPQESAGVKENFAKEIHEQLAVKMEEVTAKKADLFEGVDKNELNLLAEKCTQGDSVFGREVNLEQSDREQIKLIAAKIKKMVESDIKDDPAWEDLQSAIKRLGDKGTLISFVFPPPWLINGGESVSQINIDESEVGATKITVPAKTYNAYVLNHLAKNLNESGSLSDEILKGRSAQYLGEDLKKATLFLESRFVEKQELNAPGETEKTPDSGERPFIAGEIKPEAAAKTESREASGLSDKERLFAYRMWSGDWKATEVPNGKDEQTPETVEANAREVFNLRNDELDAYEKVCRTRASLKKKEKELIDSENKYKVAKDAYEKRLDRFKLDLLNDFIKSNKEKYPGLSEKQLADAALKWQHQSLLETIQNLDGNTRLLAEERERNAREIGMLRNMWNNFNQMPQWQKVAIGVAAAGVIGAGTVGLGGLVLPMFGFSAPSGVAALSIGGVAMKRRAIGGALGAGLQAAVDKLFISKRYGKERGKVSQEEQEKTAGHLNTELRDYVGNWVEDEEKKLKMMEIVDKDAKEYRARLDDITRREGKVRGWSALATGLIGGGSVLAYENWDNIVSLFQGTPKGSAIGLMERPKAEAVGVIHEDAYEAYKPWQNPHAAVPGEVEPDIGSVHKDFYEAYKPGYNPYAAVPSEAEGAISGAGSIEPSDVEKAQEMGYVPSEPSDVERDQEMRVVAALDSKFAGKVYTVKEGDSLWSITRKMVKDGLVSEDQWKDGWQNSTVELASGKKVPLSETGLIHAGDQVKIMEEGGKIRFAVEDYAHDSLKLSDNQGYYEYLKNAGKTPPKWLEDAVAMKSWVKSALEAQGAELHELVLSSTSESAEAAVAGEPLLFPEALRTQYLEEFSGASLARQEEIMAEIASQRETINSLEGAAWDNPEQARHLARSAANALDFENSLRTSEMYLSNIEALGAHLKEHGVSPYFFNRVKDVTVGDFMALSKGEMAFADSKFGYLENQFRLYPDKWQKIASLLELNQPGRPEKMLILEKFVKKLIG